MSKNMVFYFTGTGNSLKVAKDIGSVLDNCEINSMTTFNKEHINNDYDRIGFIFPVYAEGIPNAVKRFISNTKFPKNNPYYFTVATHGGLDGNAIPIIYKQLSERGIYLNAGFEIKMVANYVCKYNMVKNIEKIKNNSQKKIDVVKELVKNKVQNRIKRLNPLIFWPEKAAKSYPTKDKGYNISEKCIGCSICYKVCPVKNIEMENNRPIFKNNCEQCMACIQYCPNKSINYKNKTQKRRRYTNPDININEIIRGNNNV